MKKKDMVLGLNISEVKKDSSEKCDTGTCSIMNKSRNN
jgi:hypothetical protein